jgi:asparagine synthetase B (glutamine-hydrolysing)
MTLDKIICQAIEKKQPSKRVALLLSGGVDSQSVGFACKRLGLEVIAYTFQVGEWESPDVVSSRKTCEKMEWDFNLIKVPLGNLINDFKELAVRWECKKKTQFECTWPFLYVYPCITEEFVLTGLGADGYHGLSKKAMIHFKQTKEKFDEFRTEHYGQKNLGGQLQQLMLCKEYDITQIAPYLDPSVFNYFLKYDWDQLNKPRQKTKIIEAFRDEFLVTGVRKHRNLQLISGIDKIFHQLLKSDLNFNNRTRVMDLCRDYSNRSEARI